MMAAASAPETLQDALGELNVRQQRFILLYHSGETKGNGRNSYIEAGYKATGAAADVSACQLLSRPKVVRVLDYLRDSVADAVVDCEINYQRQWYEDMQSDLDAARADGAHGPVMTGNKLLASSKRYDLEVNKVTHDLAPELRSAIADRIAGARARTIQLNEGEDE
jgi:hypothetical protein